MNILVVSEVGMFRHYMERLVQSEGHQTCRASTIQEVEDILGSGRRLDLIITDWTFSGSSAREIVLACRKVAVCDDQGNENSLRTDFIILVTPNAKNDEREHRRLMDSISVLGIGEVIEKPFDRNRITTAIRQAELRRRRSQEKAAEVAPRNGTSEARTKLAANTVNRMPGAKLSTTDALLLQAAMEHAPFGMLIADQQGKIRECNPPLARIFGYEPSDLIGHNISRLVPSPHAERHDDYIRAFIKSGNSYIVGARRALLGRHREGRLVRIELRVEVIRRGDEWFFVTLINELGRAGPREFSRAASDEPVGATGGVPSGEVENNCRSEILARFNHSVRTPMTAILGYSQMLMEGEGFAVDERTSALQTVYESGRQLQSLLSHFVDWQHLQSGLLPVKAKPTPLATVIGEAVSRHVSKASNSGVSIRAAIPKGTLEEIETDPNRLIQSLDYLLEYGLLHREASELVLDVAAAPAPSDSATPSFITIRMVDPNPGIPPGLCADQFEPLAVHERLETQNRLGTGFELPLARAYARLLGGDLTVIAEPPGSRSLVLTLPTRQPTSEQDEEPQEFAETLELVAAQHAPPAPLHGRRLLLAEDGEVNQRLLTLMLRNSGAEVIAVENGQLAVDRVLSAQSSDRPFDVVLMDLQMPVMDGFEATRRLRDAGVAIPIIALSALSSTSDRERCLSAGCTKHISKPVDRKSLIAAMVEQLSPSGTPVLHSSEPATIQS